MELERFSPKLAIHAVDQKNVVVTFDSSCEFDDSRNVQLVRIDRDFSKMSFVVEGFAPESLAPQEGVGESAKTVETQKIYRGKVFLQVDDARHLLAETAFILSAEKRDRKTKTNIFPLGEDVLLTVRQGVSDALSAALAGYYENENQIDLMQRMPAHCFNGATLSGIPAGGVGMPSMASFLTGKTAVNDSATDSGVARKRSRRRIIAVAVAIPIIVAGLIFGNAALNKPSKDPSLDAIAKAMGADPKYVQQQVDMTRETLQAMGLDPGKSSDVGCMAK